MDQRLSGANTSLDDLVRAAQRDLPEPSRLDAIETRLLTHVSTGAAGSRLFGWSTGGKLIGGALMALFAGGVWVALADAKGRGEEGHEAKVLEPPAMDAAPLADPSPAPLAVEGDERSETRPGEVAAASAPRERRAAAPVGVGATDVDGLSLLVLARKSLRDRPGHALSLLDEHARRHPKSGLSQEREVLRTMALSALGRGSEAERSAKNFSERFPDSAHQRKVQEASQGEKAP